MTAIFGARDLLRAGHHAPAGRFFVVVPAMNARARASAGPRAAAREDLHDRFAAAAATTAATAPAAGIVVVVVIHGEAAVLACVLASVGAAFARGVHARVAAVAARF